MSTGPTLGDDQAQAAVTRHGVLLALLTLVLAAFLLSGCVGATGMDEDTGGGASGLSATPSSLTFGSVNTGSNKTLNASVTNSGASDVTVSNVTVSGAGFNATGVPTGLILTPGQSAAMAVTFAPSGAGAITGKVSLSTGSANPPLAIALTGTGVTASGRTVTLNWNPSTSTVAGYRAYRAPTPGGPYTPLHSTANPLLRWTDSTVQSGTTYYYVVTAVAADTVESTYSNQATAAVPK